MKKQLIVILTVVLLICVGLSGCNESEELEYPIAGIWKTGFSKDYGDLYLTLSSNGKAEEEYEYADDWVTSGTWHLDSQNILSLDVKSIFGTDMSREYKIIKFEEYGDVLILEFLSSGEKVTWNRQ